MMEATTIGSGKRGDLPLRIHVFGASGSGTTTLGKAISRELGLTHLDIDDYFWLPTRTPYTEKRPLKERQRLLLRDVQNARNCVVTGSLCGWGDIIIPLLDLAIFLWVPSSLRLARLKQREVERFGDELKLGGSMYVVHQKFLAWAAKYDEGGLDMRSRATHEQWMKQLRCPLLRIEGDTTVEERMDMVKAAIADLLQQRRMRTSGTSRS